jgi:hypothetical protein
MKLKEYDLLRALVILAIVVYILGIVPQFTDGVRALFDSPVVKILFLGLIVFVGNLDSTIGTLLAVAFLISYVPIQKSGQRLVGGLGEGANQLVGGLSQGTQRVLGAAEEGTSQLVSGASRGLGEVVGGLGEGAEDVLKGTQEVVGGLTRGTQHLLSGVTEGTKTLTSGLMGTASGLASDIGSATQQTLSGVQGATQALMGEGFHAPAYNGGKNCAPPVSLGGGSNTIVGYNAPYNCGKNSKGKDPQALCTGVAQWKDELNAQGLNWPQGYSGGSRGSTY